MNTQSMRRVWGVTLAMVLLVAACADTDSTAGAEEATTAPTAAPATTQAPPTTQAPSTTTARQVGSAKFEEIMAVGVVKVGIPSRELMPFADIEGGNGFEPELMTEVVRRLFGDIEIEFVGVSGADRFPALADGTIDILARLTTRDAQGDAIASPTDTGYMVDGFAILVAASGSVLTPPDLAGATIVAAPGSAGYEQYYDGDGRLVLEDDKGYMILYDLPAGEDPIEAVDSGQADGMLVGLLNAIRQPSLTGRDFVVVEIGDPIPVWTADPSFTNELDAALAEVLADGTWATVFEKWFGFSAPWSIDDL